MKDYYFSIRYLASRCRRRNRNGITMVELIVATGMLVTVMCFVTSLCVQINSIWKDIGHHRVAVNELANQLEWLTRLAPEQARDAMNSLKPSTVCARTLHDPTLTGKIVKDNLGTRVVLQIDWVRKHAGKPVQLAGWLSPDPLPSAAENGKLDSDPGKILESLESDQ